MQRILFTALTGVLLLAATASANHNYSPSHCEPCHGPYCGSYSNYDCNSRPPYCPPSYQYPPYCPPSYQYPPYCPSGCWDSSYPYDGNSQYNSFSRRRR